MKLKNRRRVSRKIHAAAAVGVLSLVGAGPAAATGELNVVVSFSILGDFVRQVGGDRVSIHTIAPPGADAHGFEPTPADARAVAGADLVVMNGLGFDAWAGGLVSATGYEGPIVVAAEHIVPIEGAAHEHEDDEHDEDEHEHGDLDPHAWQDVANARAYVAEIAEALIEADPADAATYETKAAAYDAELAALDAEIRQALTELPRDRRTVVTSHDAFGYFEAAYGVVFLAPVGVVTAAEAAAGDVAELILQIEAEGIDAVFVENINDPRLIEQIADETGAAIGGILYSDALSPPGGPAPTYVDMMRHNLRAITEALGE